MSDEDKHEDKHEDKREDTSVPELDDEPKEPNRPPQHRKVG